MSYIKSVSLSKEHAELVEKERISLSAVLRAALESIRLEKTGELLDTTASLQAKVSRLMETIQSQADELQQFKEKYNVLEKET